MSTIELEEPSSAAAPEQPLDQDLWLDTALDDTFPASDPISTFHADDAIFIREARATTSATLSTTTLAVDSQPVRPHESVSK